MARRRARFLTFAASAMLAGGLALGVASPATAIPIPIVCPHGGSRVVSTDEIVGSDFAMQAETGEVSINGKRTPVSVNNPKLALGELGLYNRLWGADLIEAPGTPRLGVVVINGVVTQITEDPLGVPLNGVVLIGTGDVIDALRGLTVGGKVVIEFVIEPVRY